MKRTVYNSKYVEHYFDDNQQVFHSSWLPATEQMTEKDFVFEMEKWVELTLEAKPLYILDDCRTFFYTISPTLQTWSAQTLNPSWVRMGLRKYAHIAPEELVANISTLQFFDEFLEMNLKNQYKIEHFSTLDSGLNWLLKK
jgi:hypothetical protein